MYKRKYKSRQVEIRVLNVVDYIINNKVTIREAAKVFGVSKSTVYLDSTSRILEINPQKAMEVEKIILQNKSKRAMRGVKARKIKSLDRTS
ncbi:sporulation transcriptional regulator SpoIIID [Clostridium perfringens]|uniref:Stage III sporulation protein D n=2 Tax=Clostridium perfringens TaxID=1502 RepID=A0AAP7BW95_CLOPF|nr:sporulation transcriptional regulator SpoIIID [Clostridium perfringens]NP_612871.1 sporulation stage III protein D [Clostridium phage phi3626]AAL96812.1 transcriptional regulator [Clostridium phage phi3626]EDT22898.1 transcriptional regulator [Clostridium perfringens B str. ATCC 3626]NGU30622.1 stage III sporulation protein D [Clostridium perfringens]